MAKAGKGGAVGTGLAMGALLGMLATDIDLPSFVSWPYDRTWLVLGVAVLGAVLWRTRMRTLLALGVAAAGILWLAVAFTPLVARLAEGLVRRDAVRDADAVFVFASRLQDDGEPTQDAMSRLLRGVELVAEGRAPRLVVSEMHPPSREYAPTAREWTRRYAPRAEVLVVGPIRNTREEAVAAARLLRERGLRRVLAVTSPVHTRRAAGALEREGLEVVAVPSIETRYDLEGLESPGDRRRAFGSVAHERIGLVVYARRGWLK